jgi:hypothetical protein
MLGCLEEWWLGGIYSPNHQNGRWGRLLSYGAPDTVRCASHVTQPLGFDRWSFWHVGHRTGLVHCPVRHLTPTLTLRAQSALFTVHCSRCRWPLAQVAVAPLGTPDSPVNYSGVASQIPEGGKFGVDLPGAPDTVRWCTRHSPVAHRTVRCTRPGQPLVVFCSLYLNPFLDFLLVCVEPLAPVELII